MKSMPHTFNSFIYPAHTHNLNFHQTIALRKQRENKIAQCTLLVLLWKLLYHFGAKMHSERIERTDENEIANVENGQMQNK